MHQAAYDFVASVIAANDRLEHVIELGSRDMNGSVRPLFVDAATYVGIDVVAGAGVDEVVSVDEMDTWTPRRLAAAVVCCEVLEHVEDFASVLAAAHRALDDGGLLIVTAAGPGRRPHSGITGRRHLQPGEYYGNVDPAELAAKLADVGFESIDVTVALNDVRATARRPLPDVPRRRQVAVLVPFIDQYKRTRAIAEQLIADDGIDLIILADNGSTSPQLAAFLDGVSDPRVVVEHRQPLGDGHSIYTVWNQALELVVARLGPESTLAILNNDIIAPDNLVSAMADVLAAAPPDIVAVYPNWERLVSDGVDPDAGITRTRGAWSQGGLSGFAFAFRVDLVSDGVIPLFDERYEWIFGDGDFVEALEAAGYTAARIDGLPLEHDKSTTAKSVSWTAAAKLRDVERRKAKVAEREAAR